MAINMPHIACAACACLALGCGGEVRDSGAPSLTLLDTVVLQESESLFIGLPEVTFAVDDSGNYYVPDVAGDRLLSFPVTVEARGMIRRHGLEHRRALRMTDATVVVVLRRRMREP